jgi:UDP-galactopyranose mutase
MENDYYHVFNSMAIDDYYQNEFGALAYRSIKYQMKSQTNHKQPVPTVNLTDTLPVTRFTDWSLYPSRQKKTSLATLITQEIPCSYRDNNNERYYPVKTVDGEPQRRYKQYEDLAKMNHKCTFIGRCGQYRYLDMHQVVANSLMLAKNFISEQ